MKKVARSGVLSLVRRCSDCERHLSRNCTTSNSAASSGSPSASGSFASACYSSSTLTSSRASVVHFFKATTPPPFSSSSSSFPAAPSAVANGRGSGEAFFGGIVNPGKSQNSMSVILQRSGGRSLSSSASSESPPPVPPLPPPGHRENPPDATNPDPVTLQEQWRYATRMYSMWYAHAWGTAILAGLSFYGLGWFIKGENPLKFGSSDKKEEVLLKPE